MAFNTVNKSEPSVDWNTLMRHVEDKYGFKYRDMGKKYSKESFEEQKLWENQWMKDNGYEGKEYVRNKPEGSSVDWPSDSPEMALRREIHSKLYKEKDPIFEAKYPYLDVWRWLLYNDFMDMNNGSYHYLILDEDRLNNANEDYDEIPDYVATVLKAIKAEVLDNPAYDKEDETLYVGVWW